MVKKKGKKIHKKYKKDFRKLLLLGIVIILISGLFLVTRYFPGKQPTSILETVLTPTPTKALFYTPLTFENALKNPQKAVLFYQLCGNNLFSVPSTVGGLTYTEYFDLSENNLSALPNEISKLSSLKEFALINNRLSIAEQTRIKQLLPNVKIAFVPQKDFNPYISDEWKTYASTRYGFSFKYHPELTVAEIENGIVIKNELADFQYAYLSCAVEKAYIKLHIILEDNPSDMTPLQYLEEKWEIKISKEGDKYIVDEKQRIQGMIGEIESYKNGDINGLIIDAGESEHPTIIASHNKKIYVFQYFSGGETGSRIGEIPKAVLNQSLATFKYLD